LTDLLHGVYIQGGAIKQKEYDAIIRDILNTYKNIEDYPELAELRTFCADKLHKDVFETIYMDGNSKKYRTFTEKIA
jgi:exoribonuclease II